MLAGSAFTLMSSISRSTWFSSLRSVTLMTSISLWSCLITCSMTNASPRDHQGHPRHRRVERLPHRQALDVVPARREQPGHARQHAELVLDQHRDRMLRCPCRPFRSAATRCRAAAFRRLAAPLRSLGAAASLESVCASRGPRGWAGPGSCRCWRRPPAPSGTRTRPCPRRRRGPPAPACSASSRARAPPRSAWSPGCPTQPYASASLTQSGMPGRSIAK